MVTAQIQGEKEWRTWTRTAISMLYPSWYAHVAGLFTPEDSTHYANLQTTCGWRGGGSLSFSTFSASIADALGLISSGYRSMISCTSRVTLSCHSASSVCRFCAPSMTCCCLFSRLDRSLRLWWIWLSAGLTRVSLWGQAAGSSCLWGEDWPDM